MPAARLPWMSAIVVIGLLARPGPSEAQADEAKGLVRNIGSQRQLFVDRWLIDEMKGTRLTMHRPVRKEVALGLTKPWEGDNSAYGTVLKDGDHYRMYYRAYGTKLDREYTCCATSDDGIHWTRPSFGLIEAGGSKDNNIVFTAEARAFWESHNFTPFIDGNPDTAPEQRYKAVTITKVPPDNHKELVAYVSPDGIHWKLLRKEPIISSGAFDSQNVAFWDVVHKQYVCYLRNIRKVRSVMRSTSPDFVNWSEPVWCEFGQQPDQFYTNAITQYFREPHLYLGFPGRFVPQRKSVGLRKRKTDGVSDGIMVSSHDGLHFHRPFMEAFIRPGLNQANWGNAHINNTPLWGLLQTGPEEISIYWFENYEDTPRIRRGTVRLDGFGSVSAPYQGGEFVTRLLVFKGRQLVINYSSSAVGSVQVEIQNADGRPVEGYDLESCPAIYGDELERPVGWTNGLDVSRLAGRRVRLRFVMKDADLYAMRFGP